MPTLKLTVAGAPARATRAARAARIKRRARRRVRQRGAVVFIVAMTIGVLVSLGAFALISASTEIKSSGYERQALQTHYLSELAMVAAAQKLGADYAMAVESTMRQPGGAAGAVGDYDPSFATSGPGKNHCISLELVPSTASPMARACKILRVADLQQGWSITPAVRPYVSATDMGSLGSANIVGDFSVEVTDAMFGQPVAGMASVGQLQLSMCPVTFTVSTYGHIGPASGGGTLQQYGSSSLEQGRARVTGGPIPCPK